jgi:hypothetical protein
LKVRVAIDAKTRTVAIVHQFVDGASAKFSDDGTLVYTVLSMTSLKT